MLDNLEQLLPAAAASVAELLGVGRGLHFMATSRATLRLTGEQEFSVPTLATGDPRRLEDEPPAAIALFLERARAIRPDLAIDHQSGPLIAGICARLDGLPLALELAAARLRLFSLPALAERLEERLPLLSGGARDLPERQRTLRATIAWSEELLREPDQRLFARLGAFVGGFTLEAAEAVAGAEGDGDVVEALTALLEQSRVRRDETAAGEPRYTMLETIREYALERLDSTDARTAVMTLMADNLIRLTATLEPRLVTGEQAAAERELDAELPNIRAVLPWLEERGDGSRMTQLAGRLGRYWISAGLLSEGQTWVRAARALPLSEHALRAKLLHADGMLTTDLGAAGEGAVLLNESAALYRSLGVDQELTRVLVTLSHAEQARGAFAEALAAGNEGQLLAQRIGDVRSEASATGNLALVAFKQGDLDQAEAGITKAVALFRRTGDQRAVVIGLGNLGAIVARRGDHSAAISLHVQALDGARSLKDVDLEGWAWSAASTIAAGLGIPIDRDSEDQAEINKARDALGQSEWEESSQRGAELTLLEAVDLLTARLGDVAGP